MHRGRTLVRLAAVLLGAPLLLEGAHRAWLAAAGRPHRAAEVRAELERLADPIAALMPSSQEPEAGAAGEYLLHPYVGSERGHDTGGVLAWFRETRAPEDFAVLVMGGSVAAGWADAGQEVFARLLSEHPALEGRTVRVLNYAHPAYKQPQQLCRLAYLFSLGARPDVVVELDGFNEVAVSAGDARRRIHPQYPTNILWSDLVRRLHELEPSDETIEARLLRTEARELRDRALRLAVPSSSVLSALVLSRMRALHGRRLELAREEYLSSPAGRGERDPELHGPPFDATPAAVAEQAVRGWLESSLSMHALCAARGVSYLHVLQPAKDDAGAKPLSPEERALEPTEESWIEGLQHGYPLLRRGGERLRASGVAFHDESRVFAEVEAAVFEDPCHLNQLGSDLLSDAIAADLLPLLPGG